MEQQTKKYFDALEVQKAHDFESDEVGETTMMGVVPSIVEELIVSLEAYQSNAENEEELRKALIADYQTILQMMGDATHARIMLTDADANLLFDAALEAVEKKLIDDCDLPPYLTMHTELLYHRNHDVTKDDSFYDDDAEFEEDDWIREELEDEEEEENR